MGSACGYVLGNMSLNWYEARTMCRDMGGDLMPLSEYIQLEPEMTLVHETANNEVSFFRIYLKNLEALLVSEARTNNFKECCDVTHI